MNTFWRCLGRQVFAITLVLSAVVAKAENIGLRFLVADPGAPVQRQAELARLQAQVTALNGFYRNSSVDLVAEIVEIRFLDYVETDALQVLAAMQSEAGVFAGHFAEAAEVGADYTLMLVSGLTLRGKPICGRAVAVNRTIAEIADLHRTLAVLDRACPAQTLAHELGHLMGLNHGAQVDQCEPGKGHRTAITPYANGFAVGACDGKAAPGKFGDIMVGGWMKAISGDGRAYLPLYSNASLSDPRCGQDQRCGDAATGDAARALNEYRAIYAAIAEPDAYRLITDNPALRSCLLANYRGKKMAQLQRLACPSACAISCNATGRY